jgi:hypothetical protein
MIKGIIVNNGVDVDPTYINRICFTDDYIGTIENNPTAAAASGGVLAPDEYFYKIIGMADRHIVVESDVSTQLANLDIICLTAGKYFWRLTNTGTTRKFVVSSDPNGQYVMASGTRSGDGAITLSEQNGSKMTGSVTVTYSADDVGQDNIVNVYKDIEVGITEVSATTTIANATIDLTWDAITAGYYRIYRGTTTGIYDGFMSVTSATSFSDTGATKLEFDWTIVKEHIQGTHETFIDTRKINDVVIPLRSYVHIILHKEDKYAIIACNDVTNKPTWHGTTEAATKIALLEINSWLL